MQPTSCPSSHTGLTQYDPLHSAAFVADNSFYFHLLFDAAIYVLGFLPLERTGPIPIAFVSVGQAVEVVEPVGTVGHDMEQAHDVPLPDLPREGRVVGGKPLRGVAIIGEPIEGGDALFRISE